MVLEGAPETGDMESVAVEWARGGAEGDEEFLVAFNITTRADKIVRVDGPEVTAAEGKVSGA